MKAIKDKNPKVRFVISTTTQTGHKIAKKITSGFDRTIYFPLDISFIMQRVINHLKPELLLLTETEIWPNLISVSNKNKIPIALINGRISPGSFKGYWFIGLIFRHVLRKINIFCMQTDMDAKRIIQLGAKKENVHITGSIKFDAAKTQIENIDAQKKRRNALGISENDILLVAGSTHSPEEKTIIKIYKSLLGKHPKLKLLIAPRHIERTGEIEGIITRENFKSVRLSKIKDEPLNVDNQQPVVFLLDSIGELREFYFFADIVFVGGSLIRHGGQNLIEPASIAKSMLYGPHVFNFQDISDLLLKENAAIMVQNGTHLKEEISSLLNDTQKRYKIGQQARLVVEQNKGASIKTLQLIEQFLK